MATVSPRDLALAVRAKRHGARYSLRIVLECRRSGLPISAGFALIEKESGFRNVFGHDPVQSIPRSWQGTTVTRRKYQTYKANRKAGRGMQGVGPPQITWYEYQDEADRLGGCWVPKHSIRMGMRILSDHRTRYLSRGYGRRDALRLAARDYNGSGDAAERYGRHFLEGFDKWHRRLA